MKSSKILAAVAVAVAAIAGAAHAETYEGVHALTNGVSRDAVAKQAVAAARAGDQFGEASASGAVVVASTASRSQVRAEAVAKSHDPLASLDRRAFYRDQVPAQYNKRSVSFTQQAAR